ncbi:MAG: 2-oxoacid:acceptor oxidoreductase subunit alpha, partial [Gemmatimonadetes bacterium]|nr:2-oxoacid:acceptor oxidoreductase subunit alpha [Gemmatimonadota bacterium]
MSDTKEKRPNRPREAVESVVIRFAGDSGDGMQLTGTQFSNTAAFVGNDISTLPDFPAEIRAPAGSLPGVSAFQLNFSSVDILTPGDEPDVLVAMNPAALKTNLRDLKPNGRLIVNTDAFTPMNLRKAGYETNPLEDGSIHDYQVIEIPITSSNSHALQDIDLPKKSIDRSKNFWALGLLFWLYDRPLEPTLDWVNEKFGKSELLVLANITALKAGYAYADASELFTAHYLVERAVIDPGTYRKITGNEAIVLGAVAASILAKTPLVYASYPITPASDILHMLSHYRHADIRTVQAEDEIAAMGAVLGAAFAGSLAMTGTSGPGLALKAEAMGLALMTELPCVVVDIQRAGPSTGMPTKTEQSDLLQAMFGRNGDSPVAVVAPATPSDCFQMTIEAFRLAVRGMVPTVLLSDGYLGNGAEPWKLPDIEDLEPIVIKQVTEPNNGTYLPYLRDKDSLARPWAVPGTANLEHRIGGLEKADKTGNVSYDHENHERMT